MIVEAEKSHDFPSVSWGPRKAASVVLVQTRRAEMPGCQCLRAEEHAYPAQAQRANLPFLHVFYLSTQWIG